MKHMLIILCATVLSLAACSSDGEDEKNVKRLCPQTAIVRDLERVKDYGSETPDEKALVATAIMLGVRGKCEYTDEGAHVNFELKMAAGKEARLGGNRVSFPFFVAVLNPEREILSKELMTADFTFSGDSKTTEQSEGLHVFIPMAKDADGTNYQVLMGFQITADQLDAVRKAEEPAK